MGFLVIACSRCRMPWALEARHATSRCPRCQHQVTVAKRQVLWRGESAASAREAAGQQALAMHGQAAPTRRNVLPRHDSPIDAAAAKGRSERNLSRRAELVADWLVRLAGPIPHDDLREALVRAGIDGERADSEIVRMLACDIVWEPRAGVYGWLGPED